MNAALRCRESFAGNYEFVVIYTDMDLIVSVPVSAVCRSQVTSGSGVVVQAPPHLAVFSQGYAPGAAPMPAD